MSTPSTLVVNTNPLLNLLRRGPIQLGTINRVPNLEAHAEGKGVNVARVLGRLGHRVIVTGFAGGHSGAWLRELIQTEGLDERFVNTQSPLRMGFMASNEHSMPTTSILQEGFSLRASECENLMQTIRESLEESVKLLILSGSVPDPAFAYLYPMILEAAAKKGVPSWLDAHGEGLLEGLSCKNPPQLAKPNREEFTETKHWSRVPEVHVTDAGNPVEVFINGKASYEVVPPSLHEVNPIGCGDCYLAGLAHGYLEGWNAESGYRFASACGAANAIKADVAQITREEADAFLDQVEVRRKPA